MNKGFTLIELLVVVLILGILAAVALPQYQKAVEKSRLAEMHLMRASLEKGLELYILQHGLPAEGEEYVTDQLDIDFTGQTPTITVGETESYCTASGVCVHAMINSNGGMATVEMRKRSGMGGAPDYGFTSYYSPSTGWSRNYFSCGVDIGNFGLEELGYEEYAC